MNSLAKRLKHARVLANLNQEQLAERSGLKQPDVSKIERGLIQKTTALLALARALNCNPDWLDTGAGEMYQSAIDSAEQKTITGLTQSANELGLLYDMIPVTDLVRRSRAWSAATEAIRREIEGH